MKIVKGFLQEAPSHVLDWVLSTSQTMLTHIEASNTVISKLQNPIEKCKNVCILNKTTLTTEK